MRGQYVNVHISTHRKEIITECTLLEQPVIGVESISSKASFHSQRSGYRNPLLPLATATYVRCLIFSNSSE